MKKLLTFIIVLVLAVGVVAWCYTAYKYLTKRESTATVQENVTEELNPASHALEYGTNKDLDAYQASKNVSEEEQDFYDIDKVKQVLENRCYVLNKVKNGINTGEYGITDLEYYIASCQNAIANYEDKFSGDAEANEVINIYREKIDEFAKWMQEQRKTQNTSQMKSDLEYRYSVLNKIKNGINTGEYEMIDLEYHIASYQETIRKYEKEFLGDDEANEIINTYREKIDELAKWMQEQRENQNINQMKLNLEYRYSVLNKIKNGINTGEYKMIDLEQHIASCQNAISNYEKEFSGNVEANEIINTYREKFDEFAKWVENQEKKENVNELKKNLENNLALLEDMKSKMSEGNITWSDYNNLKETIQNRMKEYEKKYENNDEAKEMLKDYQDKYNELYRWIQLEEDLAFSLNLMRDMKNKLPEGKTDIGSFGALKAGTQNRMKEYEKIYENDDAVKEMLKWYQDQYNEIYNWIDKWENTNSNENTTNTNKTETVNTTNNNNI